MTRKSDDPIALQVRMTEGLRHRLAKAAEQNGRSLNSEILWRLEETFPKDRSKLWVRPLDWSPAQLKEMVEEILDERGIPKKKKEER